MCGGFKVKIDVRGKILREFQEYVFANPTKSVKQCMLEYIREHADEYVEAVESPETEKEKETN